MPGKRARQFHYVSQVEKMPISIDEMQNVLEDSAQEWAYIVHDKDDTPAHVHAVFKYENAKSVTAVAKSFDEPEPALFNAITGANDYQNAVAYMTHSLPSQADKAQYQSSEVHASYDYGTRLAEIKQAYAKKQSDDKKLKLEDVLQSILAGNFDSRDAITDLIVSQNASWYVKHEKAIDTVWAIYVNRENDKLKTAYREAKKPIETWFIYGEAGTGKSSISRVIGGSDAYQATSGNDPFGGLKNRQKVGVTNLILDDMKGADDYWDSQRLLQLTDSWADGSHSMLMHSRFSDIDILYDKVVINSVYSPEQFWQHIRHDSSDDFAQFKRRLTHVLELTNEAIYEVTDGKRRHIGINKYSEIYRDSVFVSDK